MEEEYAAYQCPFCGECYTEKWIGSHVGDHLDDGDVLKYPEELL